MTSTSSLKRILGTAATGRAALAKGGVSMPGDKKHALECTYGLCGDCIRKLL